MKTSILKQIQILLPAVGMIFTLATTAWAGHDLESSIDEIVNAREGYGLFSGSILVAQNGEIVYSRSVGDANKEYHIPNSGQTRYNISSISKCFLATLTMQLIQSGQIELTDPITRFFPDCSISNASGIQIQHLLNHSSGLGDYRGTPEYEELAAVAETIDDILPLVFDLEPLFAPGEHIRYSNAGVLLEKAIIERVTGLPLPMVMTDRILKPLGLNDTAHFIGGNLLENRATAYRRAAEPGEYVRVLSEPSAYTGGGIYTTAGDLLRFAQSFDTEQLLNADHIKIMTTPVGPDKITAFGWFIESRHGTTIVGHAGGSGGFASQMRRYPSEGFDLIVLSNCESGGYELTDDIEAAILGQSYELVTERDRDYQFGLGLQQNRSYEHALMYFEKNIQGNRPHMLSLYQAAKTRILGKFEGATAVSRIDRYIELADEMTRPSLAAAYWRKGMALELEGDSERAIVAYKRCLDLDPTFVESREALAKLGVVE
jgi:CubicO group peptidase (beta-lactamase class C family)